jgi:hypothetical protein
MHWICRFALFAVCLAACSPLMTRTTAQPSVSSTAAKPRSPSVRHDIDWNLRKSSLAGLTVGMSPLRVREEALKNDWKIDAYSTETLEDIANDHDRWARSTIGFDAGKPSKGHLDLTFVDQRLAFIKLDIDIEASDYQHCWELARKRLESLGTVSESPTANVEGRMLLYSSGDLQYRRYEICKIIKDQKGWITSEAICDFSVAGTP